MSRVVATIAMTLTLTLLAAACTGSDRDRGQEQDPDIATTVAPSDPQTATAPAEAVPRATEAPNLPAQATENNDAGAKAFARHWLGVFNYAHQTGFVDDLQSVSATSCGGCRAYIEQFSTTYSAGGSIEGADVTPSNLRSVRAGVGVDWSGVGDLKIAAATVFSPDGKPDRIEAAKGRLTAQAVWEAGAWKMQLLTIDVRP